MTATRARLSDWSARLAAVEADPTDEALQRLCAILDVADADVVRRWDEPGHEERRARLASMRAEARRANSPVSTAIRRRQSAAGRTNGARQGAIGAGAGLMAVGGAVEP